MHSAMSSLQNTGSFFAPAAASIPTNLTPLAPLPNHDDLKTSLQLTKFIVDFNIEKVDFKMSQLAKIGNSDEEIFNFEILNLEAETIGRTFDLTGKFQIGGIFCTHLMLKTPEGQPVPMLSTSTTDKILQIQYKGKKKREFFEFHFDDFFILNIANSFKQIVKNY